MKRVLAILLVTVMLLSGCVQTNRTSNDAEITVGISFDSFVVERWQRELEILVASLGDMGAKVEVQIANEDKDVQIEQIQYLINQNVDVLIVVPNDSRGLTEILGEASRKGIKVIAYDRLLISPDVDLYISFDNEGIGKAMTTRLLEAFDSKAEMTKPYKILVVSGDPKDYNAILLRNGVFSILQPLIDSGDVILLEEVWAEGWREQYASVLLEEQLDLGNQPDGVIAANDLLASAVVEVLSKWQMTEKVLVVSQDAELSACQRIVEKTQLATVYKPLSSLANTAANAAMSLARGEEPTDKEFIYNEYRKIPYIKLDAYVVDLSSIDALIINSGFHLRKDVYLNIEK